MLPRAVLFPIALNAQGQIATAEQGSTADIASCIAVALNYPLGKRRGKPDFGVRELNFDLGVDTSALRDAVLASEPRAATVQADVLKEALGIAQVEVGFGGPSA